MKLVDKKYRSPPVDRFSKNVRSDVFSKAVLSSQKGFTLLEMLVVAAILLVVAGGVVTSFRDVGSDAADQAARYQMQQLGEAIEAYYKDNGSFPARNTPADLSFLFEQTTESNWSTDYRRGWRGPYLNGHKYLYLDIGDDLTSDGSSINTPADPGEPFVIDGAEIPSVIGIADPYDHYPVDDGQSRSVSGCSTSGANDCLLEWRKISGDDSTLINRFGRPYLAIDLEVMADSSIVPGVPRLVSFGSNGIYEPNSCDYTETDPVDADFCDADLLCSSSGDDIVLCLR
ncbi:prepilin-type N-terminal cleavage/methylation domain-containing protein [Neptuniibacter sp. QD37_6]|uniref:prepilin-type N-terminal cleavage/methylation domain-containing protein n=1 Tax=Neptuniibacter sp. QD37_6 TaxID=3398210 RepID=UPI0039F56918